MKTVAFVPVKLNNERTPGKNVKPFSDGTLLISFIQKILLQVSAIDEIFVFCSDERIKEYLLDGVQFLAREKFLDTPKALANDLVKSFTSKIDADIYVKAHVTAPFLNFITIEKMIAAVQSGEYDSAFPVTSLQEFLWKDGVPLNHSQLALPRTQDLDKIFVETTGAYVFTKEVSHNNGRRIGDKPLLLEVSKIEAIDIDYPIDFEIANAIYQYFQAPPTHSCLICINLRAILLFKGGRVK
jgi:CMP-N-acetylneuraminic acid synthetase